MVGVWIFSGNAQYFLESDRKGKNVNKVERKDRKPGENLFIEMGGLKQMKKE